MMEHNEFQSQQEGQIEEEERKDEEIELGDKYDYEGSQVKELCAGKLVELCENVVKNYNPVNSTLDSHAEDFLTKIQPCCEKDKVFASQVLYGCVRFKGALKAFLTAFYYNNGATAARTDYTKYLVLSYLFLFRIQDIGFPGLVKIVKSQAANKMHTLLSFIFSKELLEKWVKDEWIKMYDLKFVENELIDKLSKYEESVKKLLDQLSSDAFGLAQKKEEATKAAGIPQVFSKPPTIVKPFNITPARPVRVPEPMKIKQEIIANPMPENLNERTLVSIQEEREKAKEKVREETMKKYVGQKEFNLHETKDTLSKAIAEQDAKLQKILSKKFVANPVPDFDSKPANVKMNTSAVLREDALYKKKQAAEAKLLKAYEQELRDSSEFYKWQSERRKEDEQQRLELVEKRRMESTASQEEARLANVRKVEENRKVASEMRRQGKVHAENKVKREQAFIEKKKQVVRHVQSRKDAPAIEKAKIFKQNRIIQREMRKEQKRLEAEKRRKDHEEQLQRNDLIRRIRALERVPTKQVTAFDPTTSSGHGLLDEMSLLELKERLAMNQIKESKMHLEKKKRILKAKTEKEQAMKERLLVIKRARDTAAKANRLSRVQKRQADEERARLEEEVKEEAKLKLVEKLAKIRSSREEEIRQLQEEEERLQKRNMFLGAAKDMVEEKVHEEFLAGCERKAKYIQHQGQLEAYAYEQIKARESSIRQDNRRKEAIARRAAEQHAATLFEHDKKKAKEKAYTLVKEKRYNVTLEQQRYKDSTQKLRSRNPYATKIIEKNMLKKKEKQN